MRLLSTLFVVFLLAGCSGGIDGARDRVADLFATDKSAAKQPATPVIEPRYCYRTLGKVNCYTQPLPGEEANRLIGYQGPAPRSTAGTGALTP